MKYRVLDIILHRRLKFRSLVSMFIQAYVDHFDLERHIRYSTDVKRVEKATDYDITGRWTITSACNGGEVKQETFDAVMVCTGLFSDRNMVEYPGQDEFTGEIMHSNEYKKADGLANGKNVLVVGKYMIDIRIRIS